METEIDLPFRLPSQEERQAIFDAQMAIWLGQIESSEEPTPIVAEKLSDDTILVGVQQTESTQ